MLYIGSHTSYLKDKGLLGVVNESISYGANIFMFYTGSNQSTLRFPIDKELTKKAHEKMLEYGLDKTKCIVHAPFIINLANNTSEEKYEFYINFLRQELNRCIELDIRNIVLHPGSYTTLDRKTGIKNIANGLNIALDGIDGVNLLLEFMSGKGTEVGTSISDLKEIIDLLDQSIKEKVFVCLDTCHMNDAGIDISKFDEFLDDFEHHNRNEIKDDKTAEKYILPIKEAVLSADLFLPEGLPLIKTKGRHKDADQKYTTTEKYGRPAVDKITSDCTGTPLRCA